MAKKDNKKSYKVQAQRADAPARKADGKKLSRKERKLQKKALLKRQLELEKQLVAEGRIPARNKYRCNNFFGRAVALCLVFLFGIFATVGAFFGFGAFAPVRDVLWLAGLDYHNLFYDEYAAQSLFDITRDIMANSFDSLSSLGKYTPVVDKYVDTLAESLTALGVVVDKGELKSTPFSSLGTYFKDDILGNVVLGDALNVTPNDSNRMMVAICYGNRGVDYTIDANNNIVPITPPVTLGQLSSDSQSVIDRVNVEDAFDVSADSNAAMRFLAFGTEGLNYEIVDGAVVMLNNELTGLPYPKKTLANLTSDGETPLENAKISDLMTVESDTGLLAAIRDWTINDLKQNYRIERLKISQVMTIDDNSSLIAKAIKDWRLCDIRDPKKTDTLRLGDIIAIDETSPRMLRSLENSQIGDLSDDVNALRLMDILEEEDIAGNNFLKSLKLSPVTSLGADLKKLSAAELFGDKMYSYLELKGPGSSFEELYKDYKDRGRNDPDESASRPEARAIDKEGGEAVRSYFVAEEGGDRLQRGFYCGDGPDYKATPERTVYSRRIPPASPEEEETVEYFIRGEQKLTPTYNWKLIDYENAEHFAALPADDKISAEETEYAGCIIAQSHGGEPYCDSEGRPYYYITTRTAFADGAPSENTERIAYPVCSDGFGLYYTYLKYTPGGGADEFREVRVDLEYTLDALSYGEGPITLTKNAAGDWSYLDTSGETAKEVVIAVHEKDAEYDPETGEETSPAYYYFKTDIPVQQGYFAETALHEAEATGEQVALGAVYGADAVTEKFEIVKTVEGATVGDPVAVDRYLSGAWFFLFADEREDGGFDDRAQDTPVLDLTGRMQTLPETLSGTELWRLYFHGLVTVNPFVQLAEEGVSLGGKTVHNYNECTLKESVELVRKLSETPEP